MNGDTFNTKVQKPTIDLYDEIHERKQRLIAMSCNIDIRCNVDVNVVVLYSVVISATI